MKLSFTKSWTVILTLLALTFSAVGVTPAHAATLTVNSTSDAVDAVPGNGVCETAPGNGVCTLRAAIQEANALPGDDTITFSVSGPIPLGSTLPTITSAGGALTIDRTGQTLIISGNNVQRVMYVDTGASLTLNNLTIANGKCTGCDGGGVYNAGTLIITNSTFSGNGTSSNGGGIYNTGTLIITNSTFSGNIANTGVEGVGGGIYNSTGMLTITNSTFSGNNAYFWGGGIYCNSGTMIITNSTFSNNSATPGAGIYNNACTVTLGNTIVANNTGGNCFGMITDGGNNLDSANTCGFTTNAKINADPNLGAPTGSPAYFPLNAGSPAIDAGNDTVCAAAPVNNTSQNGLTRPQGAHCDIGSYEFKIYTLFLPLILR